MNGEEVSGSNSLFTPIRPLQFVQVAAIGLLVGAFSWIFAEVIGMYMLKPPSCSGNAFSCAASSQPAVIISSIMAAFIGLFGLVKLQVFRPLLVVIATMLSLWGLVGALLALPWYIAVAVTIGMHVLGYMVFTWLARIRTFWLAVVMCIALVVALRLIITA